MTTPNKHLLLLFLLMQKQPSVRIDYTADDVTSAIDYGVENRYLKPSYTQDYFRYETTTKLRDVVHTRYGTDIPCCI